MFYGIIDWFRCRLCEARFPSYPQARRHLLVVHGCRPGEVAGNVRYDDADEPIELTGRSGAQ